MGRRSGGPPGVESRGHASQPSTSRVRRAAYPLLRPTGDATTRVTALPSVAMSHTPVLRRSAGRAVPVALLVVAASLAVSYALHLSWHVTGRGAPYDPDGAGIAEAVLGAELVAGAAGILHAPRRARTTGLVATGIVT